MKNSLVGLFLLFSAPIFAQLTVTEQFQKIVTVQQAQQYIDANAPLKPVLLHLASWKDSTLIDKRLPDFRIHFPQIRAFSMAKRVISALLLNPSLVRIRER